MVAALKRTSEFQSYMRLVRDEEEHLEATGRERRVFPRRESNLTVMGRRLDHTLPARREPVLTLNLRDISVGGISALVQSPLAPGERIGVWFPPEGMKMGWSASGRVLRCEPSALGYRVAVEFEALPKAA